MTCSSPFALFVLVGGVAMLQAYWFPPYLRAVHSLEMLAGEFTYTAALVWLLGKKNPTPTVPTLRKEPIGAEADMAVRR